MKMNGLLMERKAVIRAPKGWADDGDTIHNAPETELAPDEPVGDGIDALSEKDDTDTKPQA